MVTLAKKPEIQDVPVRKMTVSEAAQRRFRPHRMKDFVPFDMDMIGVPVVSMREGKYFVVDGQHRVAAIRENIVNAESISIRCKVYFGLSERQEAELFLFYNNSMPVRTLDKFRVAVTAGHDEQVAITEAVESAGFRIAASSAPGGINCVAVLQKIYSRAGASIIARSLKVIADTFGEIAVDGPLMNGVAHVLQRYDGQIRDAMIVERLRLVRGGTGALRQAANEHRNTFGTDIGLGYAAAIVDAINGRGRKKLIPVWWSPE